MSVPDPWANDVLAQALYYLSLPADDPTGLAMVEEGRRREIERRRRYLEKHPEERIPSIDGPAE